MHLLSDCRQNNNLTEKSGLCKAGWPVNKKAGGGKYLVEEGKTLGRVEDGIRGVYSGVRTLGYD